MTLEERMEAEITKANFDHLELKGFEVNPMLAVKAGIAIGYRMGMDDLIESLSAQLSDAHAHAFNLLEPRTEDDMKDDLCEQIQLLHDRTLERAKKAEQRIAELERQLAGAEQDAERWKERAEYEYGRRVYESRPGLGVGALDATMAKGWRWKDKQKAIDAAIGKGEK